MAVKRHQQDRWRRFLVSKERRRWSHFLFLYAWLKQCWTLCASLPFLQLWFYVWHTHYWIACWLECLTHNWKVASSNPGRSGGRIFFSRVNLVCWFLFSVCSSLMLPQWHVKDPGQFAKSAGGRLHLNRHTPLTQWSQSGLTMPLSRHSLGTYRGNKLIRNLSGSTPS